MKQITIALALALCFGTAHAGRFLKGSRIGAGSATVTWQLPEDSVSTSQTGTKVYKSLDRVTWILVTTIADTTTLTYVVTGLTSGTWYFETSSYNATGEGNRSNSGAFKVI